MYLLFICNMFCCRLACHDTLEVPQYHRGRGSVFVIYLEYVLLSTYFPRNSRSTIVPQGGAGGSVFAIYLAHVLLSTYSTCHIHSGSTTIPEGGGG